MPCLRQTSATVRPLARSRSASRSRRTIWSAVRRLLMSPSWTYPIRIRTLITGGPNSGGQTTFGDTAMTLPDFLTEHAYGEISLTGHRIGLYTVMRCYKEGYSAERIVEEFPTLSLDHVKKVIDFALENWDEVDAYVEAYRAEIQRQEAMPS